MVLLPLSFGWLVCCGILLVPHRTTLWQSMELAKESVSESVWAVVEAMDNLDELLIEYPDSEEVQLEIACKFQIVSEVNFSNCAGAINSILILIWI
jgi:hypothetical protein